MMPLLFSNEKKIIPVFSLGLFSMAAQAIIFREFLSAFDSGLIAVSLFFFSWLIWISISSLALLKLNQLRSFFAKIAPQSFLLYIPALALQVFLLLNFREIAGIKQYHQLHPLNCLLYSLLLNFPISVLTAIFFQSASDMLSQDKKAPIPFVHRWEALGAFTGGIFSTVLFYYGYSTITLAIFASSVIILSSTLSGQKIWRHLATIATVLLIFSIYLGLDTKIASKIAKKKWSRILPTENYLASFKTAQSEYLYGEYYGQLIFARDHGAYESFPSDEDISNHLAVAFSQKSSFKNILIAGGGLSLPMALNSRAFPDDPYYAKKALQIIDERGKNLKKKTNISIADHDIRTFLLNNDLLNFDLAFINLGNFEHPSSNRLCTTEFLDILKKNLSNDAIAIFAFALEENYLSEENSLAGAILQKTISSKFKNITIFPGQTSYIIASDNEIIEDLKIMEENIATANLQGINLPPEIIRAIASTERANFAKDSFQKAELKNLASLNTDLENYLPFLSLLQFMKKSSVKLSPLIELLKIRKIIFALPILIIIPIFLTFIHRSLKQKTSMLFFSLSTIHVSAFISLSMVILLINVFQTIFGSISIWFGLLSSLFMLGIWIGNLSEEKLKSKPFLDAKANVLIALSANFILLALFSLSIHKLSSIPAFAFFFLAFGFVNGAIFSASTKIDFDKIEKKTQSPPAAFLLADNSGAATATILSGLAAIPLTGTTNTALMLTILNLAIFAIFASAALREGINFYSERKRFFFYTLFAITVILLTLSNILSVKKSNSNKCHGINSELLLKMAPSSKLKEKTIKFDGKDRVFFEIRDGNDKMLGYIFNSSDFGAKVKGYAGPIEIAIFADTNAKLISFSVIQHSDTDEFVNDVLLKYEKLKNTLINDSSKAKNIDLVSGATQSSTALRNNIFIAGHNFFASIEKKPEASKIENKNYLSKFNLLIISLFFITSVAISIKGMFRFRIIVLISAIVAGGYILNTQFSTKTIMMILFHPWNFPLYGVAILIFTILFGNYHCGYFCPFGATQELTHLISGIIFRRKSRYRFLDPESLIYLKYLLLALFLIAYVLSGGNRKISAFDPLRAFFSANNALELGMKIAILSLIASLFYPRLWCRCLCPTGAFLSLISGISFFKGKMPSKKYPKCPFAVKNIRQLDCLNCDLCRDPSYEADLQVEKNNHKKIKKFFIFALIISICAYISMVIFAISVAGEKIKKTADEIEITESPEPPPGGVRRANEIKIKEMIREKKLSDKEAYHYIKTEE